MLDEVIRWSSIASTIATLGLLIVTTMYVLLTRRTVGELRDARLAELQPIFLIYFVFKDESTIPTLKNVGRGNATNVQYQWLIGTDHDTPPNPDLQLHGCVGEQDTILPGEETELPWYDSELESVGRYLWLTLRYEDAQRNAYHRTLCYALGGGERLISDTLYRTLARERPAFGYDRPLFPASGTERVFSVQLRSAERDLQGQITAEREYLQQLAKKQHGT